MRPYRRPLPRRQLASTRCPIPTRTNKTAWSPWPLPLLVQPGPARSHTERERRDTGPDASAAEDSAAPNVRAAPSSPSRHASSRLARESRADRCDGRPSAGTEPKRRSERSRSGCVTRLQAIRVQAFYADTRAAGNGPEPIVAMAVTSQVARRESEPAGARRQVARQWAARAPKGGAVHPGREPGGTISA